MPMTLTGASGGSALQQMIPGTTRRCGMTEGTIAVSVLDSPARNVLLRVQKGSRVALIV